jgi:hypothetical protein
MCRENLFFYGSGYLYFDTECVNFKENYQMPFQGSKTHKHVYSKIFIISVLQIHVPYIVNATEDKSFYKADGDTL